VQAHALRAGIDPHWSERMHPPEELLQQSDAEGQAAYPVTAMVRSASLLPRAGRPTDGVCTRMKVARYGSDYAGRNGFTGS
jgi:hypothetical protein